MKIPFIVILLSLFSAACIPAVQAQRTTVTDNLKVRVKIDLNGKAITDFADFYDQSATPGGTLHEGDLWFDGSAFFVYNGSAWVQVSTAGVGITDGDKGHVTVSADGTVWTIDAGVVTPAMLDRAYLENEVDGDSTNEIQRFDVAQLVGNSLQLSLSDDGEATRVIDLSGIPGSGPIRAMGTPVGSDSLNLATNDGVKGVTVRDIANLVNKENRNTLKATTENSLQKTMLQPYGTLGAVNGRISWNVRDVNKATVNLARTARLLPPVDLRAGGAYSLTIKQGSAGHPVSLDASVYHLDDTVSTVPYSTTTIHFSSPDGRNLFGNVFSSIPSDIDILLLDFWDDIELAVIPSILDNHWKEGIGTYPKSTLVNGLDSSFYVTKDRSRHNFDIYSSTAFDWVTERTDGKVGVSTTGAGNWRVRASQYLTTFHNAEFTFDVWVKRDVNTGMSPIIAVGSGSAGQKGFRLRINSNQLQFTIGDGSGTYAYDHTHPSTFTKSDGWQRITIFKDTTGTDSIHIIFKGIRSGAPFSLGAPVDEMSNDILMAYDGTGVNLTGWITNMFLLKRKLSPDELDRFGTVNLNALRYSQPAELYGRPFSPQNIRGLEWSHDWSEPGGRLYQDDAKTVAAASDNDPVHRSESMVGNLRGKEFVATATGSRPVWQSNVANGRGALYFDSTDVLQIDGYNTLKQITGDFTIVGVCRPDTVWGRSILSNNIDQYVQATSPQVTVGGQGFIHRGKSYLRMKGGEYGDYNSPYGGLTARIPRDNDDWFVFSLTKQDTLFTLNVNNVYQSAATKGDAEDVSFYYIGGTGNNAFKGHFAELHKYGRALSNRVRDSLVHTLAAKYAIAANVRTDETMDEDRIELFAPKSSQIDYVSFGQPFTLPAATATARDTGFWIGTCDALHNGQVNPANPANKSGIYLIVYDEKGFIDSIRVFKDRISDTLDARQSASAAFWGRDSLLVLGTYAKYMPGDTTVTGSSGYTEFRQRYRWVNWRTKDLGAVKTVTHPVFDSTELYISTGLYLPHRDTLSVPGYAAAPGGDNYHASLIKSDNGGDSFTNVFTLNPALGDFSYIGIDGNTYTPTGIEIDPEECKLLAMSNGEYVFTIRNDLDDPATAEDDRGFYTYISDDLDDWSSAVLRHAFTDGVSMPNITEIDRALYVSQRDDFRPGIGELKTFVWRSLDFGRTWEKVGQVDHERAGRFGVEDMYGGAVKMNGEKYVVKSTADRTLNGATCDLSLFPFDSIKKE